MSQSLTEFREAINHLAHAEESTVVNALLNASALDAQRRQQVREHSVALVESCRSLKKKAGTLDAFLQEFGLSNKEGISLMCLAESLLRVPDDETADRLIAEKIHSGDWASHKGRSDSRFVNASVWGLMLTGKVVTLEDEVTRDTTNWMKRLVSSLGEPVVRRAVLQAMRIMGGQYVLGRTIEEAMRKGAADNPPCTRFSFDMLGRARAPTRMPFVTLSLMRRRLGRFVQLAKAEVSRRRTAYPSSFLPCIQGTSSARSAG